MTDHYEVLGVKPNAKADEIEAAFESVRAARRAKRQKVSDVHIAHAVLSDEALRRAYDAARLGFAAKGAVVEVATRVKDAVPEIDVREVASEGLQVALKATVLVTGLTAKAADVTASAARKAQSVAVAALKRTGSIG